MSLLRHTLLAFAAALSAAAGPNQGTPDIFADFDIRESVTGNHYYFTIKLDRPCAPAAVANFLGLVTGARPWVDPATGTPSTEPFYEDTEIYKVVPNGTVVPEGRVYFGSPTNDGTGGPGYVFQDQSLDSGSGLYHVYMENNGPNTNGSRFFIAIGNQQLNKTHTRLGWVLQAAQAPPPNNNGFVNVTNLSNLNRNEDGSPFNKLTIESLTIRGWDVDDPTFLIDYWDLPVVANSQLSIIRKSGRWRLKGTNLPGSILSYFGSVDLKHWIPFSHVDRPGTLPLGADITADFQNSTRGFYRGSAVYYPVWPANHFEAPDSILQFNYIDDLGDGIPSTNKLVQLVLDFDSTGIRGVWSRTATGEPNDTGEFFATYALQDPFSGLLKITPFSGTRLLPFTFRLHFDHHFPVDAKIDRFEAFTLPPVQPESHAGRWTYTYYPN